MFCILKNYTQELKFIFHHFYFYATSQLHKMQDVRFEIYKKIYGLQEKHFGFLIKQQNRFLGELLFVQKTDVAQYFKSLKKFIAKNNNVEGIFRLTFPNSLGFYHLKTVDFWHHLGFDKIVDVFLLDCRISGRFTKGCGERVPRVSDTVASLL